MCIDSEREETSGFLCFCQEVHGTHENKGYCCDAFVCSDVWAV